MVKLNWTHEAEKWLHDVYDYIKKLKPEKGVHVAEQMVGKFKGIIPEGESSVDFLKKVRESQYD